MRKGSELPPTAGLPLRWSDFIRAPARSFAQGLQDSFGLPEPVFTCSGTAALLVALHVLQKREAGRDEVIVPAYTCPLVPLAVHKAGGLRALACDLAPGSLDFNPQSLEKLCGPRTLAVIPTHLGGRTADVAAAGEIARRYGAAVLEDAAQALGAAAQGRSVGLEGDLSFFSLAAGKGLTTYEGGFLCAKDPALRAELAEAAGRLLRPAPLWSLRRNLELLGYAACYSPSRLSLVYGRRLRRLLDKGKEEAAVGDAFSLADIPLHSLDAFRQRVAANALERLPGFLQDGAKRATKRLPALLALEGVQVLGAFPDFPYAGDSVPRTPWQESPFWMPSPSLCEGRTAPGGSPEGRALWRASTACAKGIWPFYMLLLPGKKQRDRALGKLWRSGLGVTKLFVRALPRYAFLSSCFRDGAAPCPNAEDLADRMLTVTNSPWLDDENFARIIAALGESL